MSSDFLQSVKSFARPILRRAGLLPLAQRLRMRIRTEGGIRALGSEETYLARLDAERTTFKDVANVHDLPAIFHYWSNKYLATKVRAMGYSGGDDFFIKELSQCYERSRRSQRRFVSVGAGNCDTEVRIAKGLRDLGCGNFSIECLDINAKMLERGAAMAASDGVPQHVIPVEADFNRWTPRHEYDAVIANHSLHHVLDLEHLFDAIKVALAPNGRFITTDMIGRNGHQRWPEALAIVREYWQELPSNYRYNHQLQRQENEFQDWDCSIEGFEGIRAQDILPLLVERFHFEMFFAFANVISPFVDRAFGHNFDADAEWDRAFIDRVHERDEAEILAGKIKPTQMFAVLSNTPVECRLSNATLTPGFCVRLPNRAVFQE